MAAIKAKTQKWWAARIKHGAYTGGVECPTHYVWRSMIARCTCITHKAWCSYGGRGITVCARWMEYENFVADMGMKPDGLSLDRIDNDKGYSPSNCRWATHSEQQKNKRATKYLTDGMFIGTMSECAAHVGISRSLASWRWRTQGTLEKGKPWRQIPLKINARQQ